MSDLASRITDPKEGAAEPAPATEPVPATELAPTTESAPTIEPATTAAADSTVEDAQLDGTVEGLGGSGLQEPEWDVEVSLSELQNNEATPFHSATTWQELGLYVASVPSKKLRADIVLLALIRS